MKDIKNINSKDVPNGMKLMLITSQFYIFQHDFYNKRKKILKLIEIFNIKLKKLKF